jgi:uncharacterized protein (DUF433 family)
VAGPNQPLQLTGTAIPVSASTILLEVAATAERVVRLALARLERVLVMDPLLARITIDPNICHGKPCIRGLRYPIEMLLELLSSGMTIDEILADYEDLERDDLLGALAFAARLARTRRLQPVGP